MNDHRQDDVNSVACAIVTVSDTRTIENDKSGAAIRGSLEEAGHRVEIHRIVPDEPDQIRTAIEEIGEAKDVGAILVTGGTGVTPRDRTPETIEALLEKKLDGFGEIFRALSYEEIGAAAMLSRATAGTWRGRIIFVMPGSTGAVRLAMSRLILPELSHAVGLLNS